MITPDIVETGELDVLVAWAEAWFGLPEAAELEYIAASIGKREGLLQMSTNYYNEHT